MPNVHEHADYKQITASSNCLNVPGPDGQMGISGIFVSAASSGNELNGIIRNITFWNTQPDLTWMQLLPGF